MYLKTLESKLVSRGAVRKSEAWKWANKGFWKISNANTKSGPSSFIYPDAIQNLYVTREARKKIFREMS